MGGLAQNPPSAKSVFSNSTPGCAGIAGCDHAFTARHQHAVPAMMCYLAGFQIILLTDEKSRTGIRAKPVGFSRSLRLAALWMAWRAAGAVSSWFRVKSFATLSDLASPMAKSPKRFYRITPEQVNLALTKRGTAAVIRRSLGRWRRTSCSARLYDSPNSISEGWSCPPAGPAEPSVHPALRLTGNEIQAAKYLKRAQELFPNNEDYRSRGRRNE